MGESPGEKGIATIAGFRWVATGDAVAETQGGSGLLAWDVHLTREVQALQLKRETSPLHICTLILAQPFAICQAHAAMWIVASLS